LKGHVKVEVEEKYVPQVGEVKVQLVGKETAALPGGGRLHLGLGTCQEKIVLDESRIHAISDEQLCPGTYSYPFSIYLPGLVPPTMKFEEGSDGCSVQYMLTATLDQAQVERSLDVVGAPLSPKLYPYCFQPKIFPLKSMLFMDQGFVVIAAKVENTHVGKGCEIEFSYACRDQSKKDVQRVEIQVIEQIQWRTRYKQHSRDVLLAHFPSVSLSGLEKEMVGKPWTDGGRPDEVDSLMSAEMHADLAAQRNLLKLKLPANARDSYTGKLVKISHHLSITLVMDEKSKSNPSISIPIKVFDPPMEQVAIHSSPKPKHKVFEEVATTVWPEDKVEVEHPEMDATSSCSSIKEELVTAEKE